MGVFDPLTFTRASAAWYFNAAGVLTQAASGVPRIDHDPVTLEKLGVLIEGARTNSLRNSVAAGAVVGSPGTLPTYWNTGLPTGISREIVSTGTEDGIPYVDMRFSGTNSGALAALTIGADSPNLIVAAQNQVWSGSFFAALQAGTLAIQPSCFMYEALSNGAAIVGGGQVFTLDAGPLRTKRRIYSRTLTDATTARIFQQFRMNVGAGVSIDFTLRLGAPQIEQGATVTSPILTTGSATTRSGDAFVLGNSAGWLDPLKGTFVTKVTCPVVRWPSGMPTTDHNGPRIRQVNSNNNEIRHRIYDIAAARYADLVSNSGGSPLTIDDADAIVNPVGRIVGRATAYQSPSDFATSVFGGQLTTPVPVAFPLSLGELDVVGGQFHVREIRYYPQRLTNAQIQALSA